MKRRPDIPGSWRAIVGALFLGSGLPAATQDEVQHFPEDALEDWYRVELLIFLREDMASLGSERWEPLPTLTYPEQARFLVDLALAERRLEESGAYASVIDAIGVQHLLLPAPFAPIDEAARPDSLILEPYREADPDYGLVEGVPPLPGARGGEQAGDGLAGIVAPGAGADGTIAMLDPSDEQATPGIALALPYQLLADERLDFRAEARSLRRRGQRVAFHGAWWVQLPPEGLTPALLLDRAADMDAPAWPDLQGSVRVERSRYLHVDVDLWLNTLADYLPDGWTIPSPPLPPPSVEGRTLSGTARNPWAPQTPLPIAAAAPDPAIGQSPDPQSQRNGGRLAQPAQDSVSAIEADDDGLPQTTPPVAQEVQREEATADAPPRTYPWRHAIVHRQSRRMRSNEVHYLDHPVIGVIVQLRAADEDLLPVSDESDLAVHDRHGLPVTYIEAADTDAP